MAAVLADLHIGAQRPNRTGERPRDDRAAAAAGGGGGVVAVAVSQQHRHFERRAGAHDGGRLLGGPTRGGVRLPRRHRDAKRRARDRTVHRRQPNVELVTARRLGDVRDRVRAVALVDDLAVPPAGAAHVGVKVVDAARPRLAAPVLLQDREVRGLAGDGGDEAGAVGGAVGRHGGVGVDDESKRRACVGDGCRQTRAPNCAAPNCAAAADRGCAFGRASRGARTFRSPSPCTSPSTNRRRCRPPRRRRARCRAAAPRRCRRLCGRRRGASCARGW